MLTYLWLLNEKYIITAVLYWLLLRSRIHSVCPALTSCYSGNCVNASNKTLYFKALQCVFKWPSLHKSTYESSLNYFELFMINHLYETLSKPNNVAKDKYYKKSIHSQKCKDTHRAVSYLIFICCSFEAFWSGRSLPRSHPESHRARCETPVPACAQPNKRSSPCSLAQLPNLSWLFGANQPSPRGPCDVMCCQSDVGSQPVLLSFVICGPHY